MIGGKAGRWIEGSVEAARTSRTVVNRATAGTITSGAVNNAWHYPKANGRGFQYARDWAGGTSRRAGRSVSIPRKIENVKNAKRISKVVAGAGIGLAVVGGIRNRTGPAADRMGRGRPTGVYGY
jgi:hypothetical protein